MTVETNQRRRVVVVYRRTELEELLERHATRGQVEFFLKVRGRTLAELQGRHDRITATRQDLLAAAAGRMGHHESGEGRCESLLVRS